MRSPHEGSSMGISRDFDSPAATAAMGSQSGSSLNFEFGSADRFIAGIGCDREHPGSHPVTPRVDAKDSDSVDGRPCRSVRTDVNGRQAMSDMPCFLRKTIPDGVADSWARPAVFKDSLGRWSWLATLKPSNVALRPPPPRRLKPHTKAWSMRVGRRRRCGDV